MSSNMNLLCRLRQIPTSLLLLLMCLFGNAAQAATTFCVYPSRGGSVMPFPTTITTAGSRWPGIVLQQGSLQPNAATQGAADNIIQTATVNGIPVPGFPNVYKTNLDGIGIKFFATFGWGGAFVAAPFTTSAFSVSQANLSANYVSAQLIVTGPIQSGILTSLPSMTVKYTGGCSNAPSVDWTITDGIVINALTCSVSASSKTLSVPLGIVKKSDFGAVGSTAGNANFNIALNNCSAGINLFATFTDANNLGNTSNILTLTNSSQAASGVGIRISTGSGATVSFGPDSSLPGTLNQLALGPSSAGTITIPFTAKYVKTSGTINGGVANGSATFTLSYQ